MPATYNRIASTILTSASATITFSSIPATYTDLRIVLRAIPLNSTGTYNSIRFNGDTGTNYSLTQILASSGSLASTRYSNTADLYLNDTDTAGIYPAAATIDIFSYAGSTFKTLLSVYAGDKNSQGIVCAVVGLWRSTSAINSVTLNNAAGNNYQSGTVATLYGIKAA